MSDFGFYFTIGWEHIITVEALDHIFFITALSAIYMLKDWKQVLVLVTAFTVGHTVTLALSSLRLVEVSTDMVEFFVPCTIVCTALSNLFQKTFTPRSVRINYFFALFFGLIHGLAFANTLRMLLAGDQSFALSMFGFSVGLETGQILIVFLLLLLSQLIVGFFRADRYHWVFFVSAGVMALALQMAIERWPGNSRKRPQAFHLMRRNEGRAGTSCPEVSTIITLNNNAHETRFLVFCCNRPYVLRGSTKHSKQSRFQPWEQI